jgi:hydroxymethylbilane synthase
VASRTPEVLARLVASGVDVELAGEEAAGTESALAGPLVDPLRAVREGIIDLAVVGIQALRGSAADDLTTVAVLPREEVRDVLVGLTGRATPLHALPSGSRVGLAGARRTAFLRAHRPDLEPAPLLDVPIGDTTDGNGAGGLRAVVISAHEARLAGLVGPSVEALDAKAWLPEPGQGAVALVARHPIAEATALDHLPTRTALRAELALLEALDADGDAPLGCLAQTSGRWIRLWAAAVAPDGRRLVRSDRTGPLDEPEALGAAVARELEDRGYRLVVPAAG